MAQILREPEVRAFLEKPLAAAEGVVSAALASGAAAGFELGTEGTLEAGWLSNSLLAGTDPKIGTAFVALTQVSLPESFAASPEIGLVIGVELLDEQDAAILATMWSELGTPESEGVSEVRGTRVATRPIEGTGFSVYFATIGKLALLSLSQSTIDEVLGRLANQLPASESLAQAADFASMRARAGKAEPGDVVSFLRIQPLLALARSTFEMAAKEAGEQESAVAAQAVLDGIGIDCLRSMGGVSRINQVGQIESIDQLTFDSEAQGLLPQLLAKSGSARVNTAALESIPEAALGASLSVIGDELVLVYDFAMGLVDQLQPGMRSEVEAAINAFVPGTDLRSDVLDNMKGQVVSYSAQGAGMSPSPDWMLQMESQRPDALISAIGSLAEGLGQQAGMPVKIKVEEIEGHSIHQIDLSATPLGMQLTPAIASVGDGKIVFSTSSKQLRARLTESNDPQPSLASKESLKAFIGGDESASRMTSLTYSNLAASFRAQYTPIAGMAPLLLSGVASDLPIDLSKLPSPNAIEKHLNESFGATLSDGPGVMVTRSLAQFRATDMVPLIAIAGLIGAGEAMGLEATAVKGATAVDPIETALNDLKEIRAALTVYKIAMDGYPDSLDDLVRPIPSYEGGALPRDAVPLDPWGNAYRYALEQHPTKRRVEPKLWSLGPNGVDESGAGDDVLRF